MRSIQVLGQGVTGWQVLPVDAPDFEEAALRACEIILAKDPRIGKVPGARRTSGSRATKAANPRSERRHPRALRNAVPGRDEHLGTAACGGPAGPMCMDR
jgi:hypothetical protein